MSKKLWALIIFLIIFGGVSTACAIWPSIVGVGVGSFLKGAWAWTTTQIGNICYMILTSPVAPYLFWIGGAVGFIFGAVIIHRVHMPKILSRKKEQKAAVEKYQDQMATPELYTPTKTASKPEPAPIKEETQKEEVAVEQT